MIRVMRAFFHLLYRRMAWSYDIVAQLVSKGQWQDWVMTVLPYLNGSRILELGHGPGHLQSALKSKNIRTYGIDPSCQMGWQAKRRISDMGFSQQLTRAYAQNLPFPDLAFDQVVATFPTEYIYTHESLSEIYRTLKSDGILIVLPAAWITGKKFVDRILAMLFQITGQSPEWSSEWLTPFMKSGFEAEFTMIDNKSWSVAIILAHKPNYSSRC